jgi:hypothetical protein
MPEQHSHLPSDHGVATFITHGDANHRPWSEPLGRKPDRAGDCQIFARHNWRIYLRAAHTRRLAELTWAIIVLAKKDSDTIVLTTHPANCARFWQLIARFSPPRFLRTSDPSPSSESETFAKQFRTAASGGTSPRDIYIVLEETITCYDFDHPETYVNKLNTLYIKLTNANAHLIDRILAIQLSREVQSDIQGNRGRYPCVQDLPVTFVTKANIVRDRFSTFISAVKTVFGSNASRIAGHALE